jgi:transposase
MIKRFDSWLNEEKGKFEVPHQRFTELTDDMLKYAKKVLNSKGFNAYNASKSSAMIDWTWFQGNPLEKRPSTQPMFTMSGWHGSGSYGSGKMITGIFTQNLPTQTSSQKILEWSFPFEGDSSKFSNRSMTSYTSEAYEDYKTFLIEVKKKIDETPKLPQLK